MIRLTQFRLMFAAMGAFIFVMFPIVLERAYLEHFTSAEDYVVYHAIELREPAYVGDDRLLLTSVASKYKKYSVRWNDILRCLVDGEYDFIGNYTSNYVASDKIENYSYAPWQWHGPLPTEATTCVMESQMLLDVGRDVIKEYKFTSEPFEILDNSCCS